ncbi:MAG: hypothetical protein WAN51_11735, partial [Alphaproteobacteria bacterium]
SYETSNVDALEFLKACVKDRIGARRDAGAEEKKPQAPLNPVVCHQYAGRLSVEPETLSTDELAYLDACVQTEIGYMRRGE